MGRKGGKYKRKENNDFVKKNSTRVNLDDEDMMNNEIDAFHKSRDVVPINMNDDLEESDEDTEQPVFDFEDDKGQDEDDEDDDTEDDKPPKGLAAKIVRTQKYMRSKFGEVDDEEPDDAEEEERKRIVWGGKKDLYGADVDYELQSSDDEDAAEEEVEVLRLQSERAKVMSLEDFGIEDASQDEAEMEPTFEEMLDHGKTAAKASVDKGINDEDRMTYEIVQKDLNALTKEEQMDVVYNSAPELVGLLSELNDAVEQLENKVNPLVDKVRRQGSGKKKGMSYIEVKQILLQTYCQAITFYLLLKSEGHPVRDHPVISRLVEIKSLLDKIKQLDKHLPSNLDDILNNDACSNVKKEASKVTVTKLVEETAPLESDSFTNSQMFSKVGFQNQATVEMAAESNTLKSSKNNKVQLKNQDKQIGAQSMEMLKVRASLEEKLKQNGAFSLIAPKNVKAKEHLWPVNRQLETLDDFDDEAMEINGAGDASLSYSSKLSGRPTHLQNKRKAVSGDDDIPRRDDIGERRRKHELRVLAGAGIKSADYMEDENANISSEGDIKVNEESDSDSDLEYYKQAERQRAEKLAAKSKYSRTPEVSSLPDDIADGKRHITNQMEKNRGLTRPRKKLIKNPRKKYKLKHKKAEVRRKGQVREIRKPAGPYGGEASGINTRISRSVRFKN